MVDSKPFAEGTTERGAQWRAVQYQDVVHVHVWFAQYQHWATAWTGAVGKYSEQLAIRVADEKTGAL